jgi:hypothetical protein
LGIIKNQNQRTAWFWVFKKIRNKEPVGYNYFKILKELTVFMAFLGSLTFKFCAKAVLGGQVPQKYYLPVQFQRPRVSENGNIRIYIYMTALITSKEPMLPQRAPPTLDINMKSEQYKVRVYLNVTTWAIIKSKVYFTLFFLHAKYILCMPFNCVG